MAVKAILSLDFETSGVGPDAHPVDIGAILVDLKTLKPLDSYQRYIKLPANVSMDPESEKIHGISEKFLIEKGVDANTIHTEIYQWLAYEHLITPPWAPGSGATCGNRLLLMGHNVSFDFRVLQKITSELFMEVFNGIFIDTAVIARYLNNTAIRFMGYGKHPYYCPDTDKPSVKLEHITRGMDMKTRGHSALDDATAVIQVYRDQMAYTGNALKWHDEKTV